MTSLSAWDLNVVLLNCIEINVWIFDMYSNTGATTGCSNVLLRLSIMKLQGFALGKTVVGIDIHVAVVGLVAVWMDNTWRQLFLVPNTPYTTRIDLVYVDSASLLQAYLARTPMLISRRDKARKTVYSPATVTPA